MLVAPDLYVYQRRRRTFSQDTVITEDNMNDILKYYGLDPSTVVKNDKPVTSDVTVRDLETAIKAAKQLPHAITTHDDNPANVNVTTNDFTIQETGTATVSRDSTITSSLVMKYSATGRYYKSDSTKYWTEALGADIEIASDTSPSYYYDIDEIRKLTNKVVNAGTSSSYLQMDYDYTVGYYIGVMGYGIRLWSIPIDGYSTFNSSYIP